MEEPTISKVIPKDTLIRLLRDVKTLMKTPLTDNGIFYVHDDVEVLKGYAMIVGPKDTPYFGGYYLFWRGEQWTSCQTISSVLLTLCTLLCKDPLLNEPGINNAHKDFDTYSRIIEYKNIEIAYLHMINKDERVFSPQFDVFYRYMKEYFYKNADAIAENLEKRKNENPQPEKLTTSLYSMMTILDYKKLHGYFMETKTKMA